MRPSALGPGDVFAVRVYGEATAVDADNVAARELYRRHGFLPYRLDPTLGIAQFWHKPLDGPPC